MISQIRHLQGNERKTFQLHMVYSILEGVNLGVLALNEFVFVKSLQGTAMQLGFLFQFSMVVFLFLVFLNEFFRRIPRKRLLLRYTVLFTRLPLLLMAVFPSSHGDLAASSSWWNAVFLGIFLIYYLGSPVIFPSINLLLKQNYSSQNFGRLYSYATSANKIVMLIVTFLYGWLLDKDHYAFIWVLPLVAILGIVAGFVLSSIPYHPEALEAKAKGIKASVAGSIQNMLGVLQNNPAYRHFEIGFMLYGVAFMITITVVTLYFYEGLGLNYTSVAFYRNAYNIGAIILLPFAGAAIGRLGPRRFAIIAYGAVALYLGFLVVTDFFPRAVVFWNITFYWGLVGYIFFHSVFAASMSLLWNIGSSYFSEPKDAGLYQEIHLSLTGLRALFAPLMGIVMYEAYGFIPTFLVGISILLIAMGFMAWSYAHASLLSNDQSQGLE